MQLTDLVYMRILLIWEFLGKIFLTKGGCPFVATVSITIYLVVGFFTAAYPPGDLKTEFS
jgi:hypothetical protein